MNEIKLLESWADSVVDEASDIRMGTPMKGQADRPLPYQPRGAVDGMVTDSDMTKQGKFIGKWGSSCDIPFDKKEFTKKHIQWKRFAPYLKDRPSMPWTVFSGFEYDIKSDDKKKKTRRYSNKKTLKKRR